MPVTINGTTGVIGPDGSASTPSYQGSDSNTGMFFPAADTIAFSTAGTEDMRIDSAGNVAIGTTSALTKFTVSGGYISQTDGTIRTYLGADGSGGSLVGTTTNQYFRFVTNDTERARIDSSGNLLVGTTSSSGLVSVVQASASAAAIFANASSASYTGNVLDIRTATAAGTGYTLIAGTANGTTQFQVLGNGNVRNTNNSYGAISDAKLKENVVDATPKLEKLNQVRVVNFNLIGDEQKQLGVIAQELEQIFPGMVEETADLDEEGNDLGTTTKSVKYSVFVPMLIKAVQELTARVAALEGAQT